MRKFSRQPNAESYIYAFRTLSYRVNIQVDILQIFDLLRQSKYITDESLKAPIDIHSTDQNVGLMLCLLKCFWSWHANQFDHQGPHMIFDEPIRWLAVVIIRSNREYSSLIQFLKATGLLREFDDNEYGMITRVLGTTIRHDPLAASEGTKQHQYGFTLPSSGSGDVEASLKTCLESFMPITQLCHEIEHAQQTGNHVQLGSDSLTN